MGKNTLKLIGTLVLGILASLLANVLWDIPILDFFRKIPHSPYLTLLLFSLSVLLTASTIIFHRKQKSLESLRLLLAVDDSQELTAVVRDMKVERDSLKQSLSDFLTQTGINSIESAISVHLKLAKDNARMGRILGEVRTQVGVDSDENLHDAFEALQENMEILEVQIELLDQLRVALHKIDTEIETKFREARSVTKRSKEYRKFKRQLMARIVQEFEAYLRPYHPLETVAVSLLQLGEDEIFRLLSHEGLAKDKKPDHEFRELGLSDSLAGLAVASGMVQSINNTGDNSAVKQWVAGDHRSIQCSPDGLLVLCVTHTEIYHFEEIDHAVAKSFVSRCGLVNEIFN